MQLRLISGFAALIAVLIGVGCQWSEDRFLRREVTPGELVGTWKLRAESIQDLDSVGVQVESDGLQHRIELGSDGRCNFQTFLPEHVEIMGTPPSLTSTRCRWSLVDGGDHQQLSVELLDLPKRKIIRYSFAEANRGELVIWQYIGDPDLWRYLEYSKRDP